MRLDIVRWLVARHRPTALPVPGRLDATFLEPQLEPLGDNNGPGPVRRRCDINDRYEFSGKRHTDLAKFH